MVLFIMLHKLGLSMKHSSAAIQMEASDEQYLHVTCGIVSYGSFL